MLSKSIRLALFFFVVAGIAFVYSKANAQAQDPTHERHWPVVQGEGRARYDATALAAIVYSQPHNLSGVLFQSSWLDPNESNDDRYIWDNFTLQSTQVITEVQWRGGYDPAKFGSGGPVLDFSVAIYPSAAAGTQPDVLNPPLVQYQTGRNAGETLAGTFVSTTMYDYRFSLPTPFTATAGTKYWVQIEGFQHGTVPDWGLAAGTSGDGKYFVRIHNIGNVYQLAAGDAAFTLVGPAVPISGLSATNDSPTAAGHATTFTATVSAGNGVSYAWNFGDQMAGSGRVVSHTYTAIGSYTAVVTASNPLGSVAATTTVTITDVPIVSLAAINSSPTVLGNVTSLTATIASGSNVAYQWRFGDGTLGSGQFITHTYSAVGFYTAIVTASNSASVVTATTPITIFGSMPLANAGPDQTVAIETGVTLDGSSCFAPAGHWPLTYFWQQIGGTPVVLNSYTISQPTFTAPGVPAVLTFTLTVTDTFSLASVPDQVQINVILKHYIYLPLTLKDS